MSCFPQRQRQRHPARMGPRRRSQAWHIAEAKYRLGAVAGLVAVLGVTPASGAGRSRIRQNLVIVLRSIGVGAAVLLLQLGAPGCFVQTCEREAKQRNRIFHGETSVVVQRPRCCGRVVHAARSCGPLFVCVTQALAGTFSATASNNSLACSSTRLLGSWRRHWACGSCHRACAFAPAWAAR